MEALYYPSRRTGHLGGSATDRHHRCHTLISDEQRRRSDSTTTTRGYLWGQVKDTKPWAKGSNLDVVQPGPQYQPNPAAPKFYAIRKGGDSKGYKDDFPQIASRASNARSSRTVPN